MIDYAKIANAVAYYTEKGFSFIDAPWIVSETAVNITKPPAAAEYPIDSGFLVASGEQGFLELALRGDLAPGRYGCVTACFRDDMVDRYHQRYFLKVELIDTHNPDLSSLQEIIQFCKSFFDQYLGNVLVPTWPCDPLLVMGSAYDIFSKQNIELGSYGIRDHPDIGRWVYATGCAEPRLSIAVEDHLSRNT